MPKSKHMEEGNLDLMETELRLGLPGVAAAEAHESKVMAGEERNLSTEAMDTQFKVADGIGTHNAPPKSQAVGWPPVRSIRKINVAGRNVLVKVSMDGAPYLRKVDLRTYKSYYELSCALEKMFGCFTMGRCGSHGNNVMDVRSEYVGTYEDKEGDWMVVGDVPWEMFVDSCKRIRIVKVPEANIGLAPRTLEKWGTPISEGVNVGDGHKL